MICRERPERGGLGQGDFERAELAGMFGMGRAPGKGAAQARLLGPGNREKEERKGRKNIPRELLLLRGALKRVTQQKKKGEKIKLFCPAKAPHPSVLPEKGGSSSREPFGLVPSSCSGDEFSG